MEAFRTCPPLFALCRHQPHRPAPTYHPLICSMKTATAVTAVLWMRLRLWWTLSTAPTALHSVIKCVAGNYSRNNVVVETYTSHRLTSRCSGIRHSPTQQHSTGMWFVFCCSQSTTDSDSVILEQRMMHYYASRPI